MSIDSMELVLLTIGLVLSAFFSGAEAAILSISHNRMKQLISEGGARGSALSFAARHPSDVLTTILIGNNIVNIYVASLTTTISQRLFANDVIAISVGVTTLFILVFGEIIPKTFARSQAETVITPVVRILQVCFYALYPVVKVFMFVITRILGSKASIQGRVVTKDDLQFMVDKAEQEQTIDSKQIDLLSSVLEFPTIKVKDIMVPRTQIHVVKKNTSFEDIVTLIRDVAHSRYPVVEEDLDNTMGFLHVKDLAFVTPKERENFDVTKYLKDLFFVYEHMKIQAVFDHMNRKKVHLALVKDENGLVVGIVPLEDIMEEIFGEIQDEHDDEEDMIATPEHEILENGILVPATVSLRDLYNEYDIEIPLNDNYSTLNGFLLDMLGNNFPKQGNILFWDGYSFTLERVEDSEIFEVKVQVTDAGRHIVSKSNEASRDKTIGVPEQVVPK